MVMDIKKLLKELPEHVRQPNPEIFLSDNYVCLDFETTVKDHGTARRGDNSILLACYRTGSGHPSGRKDRASIIGGEFDMQSLVDDIMLAEYVVAHNAKFELQWLRRCGLDLHNVVSCCTQINEYVLAGNRIWPLSLGACAERRGLGAKDFVGDLIRRGVDTEDIPTSMLERYCHDDVDKTEKIWLDQRKHLYARKQLNTVYTRHLFTPVLADLEMRGMKLDENVVNKLYDKHHTNFVKLNMQFEELTGGINFNSPKQVQEYLYDTLKFDEVCDEKGNPIRTAKGGRKTDSATLIELEKHAVTNAQKSFVGIKKKLQLASDALSKVLNKAKEQIDDGDGYIYASINQTNTRTHRLSSTGGDAGIQFQNINREFKPIVKARNKGWKIVEVDEAQLEFRSAAQQAGCKKGLEDIKNGVDVHAQSASVLYKDWVDKATTPDLRQSAKAETFKPLYGGEYGTPEQMQYYKHFKETYNGVTDWQNANFNKIISDGFLRLPSGLLFYWPDAEFNRFGKVACRGRVVQREICNYPVQSLCGADVVPIGIILLWHLIKDMQSFLVNTVHDSVIAEVPEEEVERYTELAEACLTDGVVWYFKEVYNYDFYVPLEAETMVFNNWGQYGD
jgi:DNA polymerase I-like protein with 3'-5' exonuclease and polymerase domains